MKCPTSTSCFTMSWSATTRGCTTHRPPASWFSSNGFVKLPPSKAIQSLSTVLPSTGKCPFLPLSPTPAPLYVNSLRHCNVEPGLTGSPSAGYAATYLFSEKSDIVTFFMDNGSRITAISVTYLPFVHVAHSHFLENENTTIFSKSLRLPFPAKTRWIAFSIVVRSS